MARQTSAATPRAATTDKDSILKAVRAAQRTACCYDVFGKSREAIAMGPPGTCDCKYGGGNLEHRTGGEETGCPELRDAHAVLEALTSFEFARVQRRLWAEQKRADELRKKAAPTRRG